MYASSLASHAIRLSQMHMLMSWTACEAQADAEQLACRQQSDRFCNGLAAYIQCAEGIACAGRSCMPTVNS